jgi:peptidoglycan lytic transglycosylase
MYLAQSESGPGFQFSGSGRLLRVAAAIILLGAALPIPAQVVNLSKQPIVPKLTTVEGDATWYKVSPNSRTKRRAGKDELTAAHNRLPYGTRVRVTHLGNGKNVIVRITDRLVTRRRTVIDLSKEAAVQLDMVREGSARVRLEILPDDKAPLSTPKEPPCSRTIQPE